MNDQLTNAPRPPAPTANAVPGPLPPRSPGLFEQVRQYVPTFLILVLLGGVGWWGFAYEWNLKKFQEQVFGKKAEENQDWCEQHGAPKKVCVDCYRDLWPPDTEYGWCKVHGVYNCAFDHPDLAQLRETPTVTAAERKRVKAALDLMPRPKNAESDKSSLKRIQLASDEVVKRIGLEFAKVERVKPDNPVEEAVSAPGEITFHPGGVVKVTSKVAGTVWRLTPKQPGARVEHGEVLALVESPEVGKAKKDFLQALTELETRQRDLERRDKPPTTLTPAQRDQLLLEISAARSRLTVAELVLLSFDLPVRAADLKDLTQDKREEHVQFLGLPKALLPTDNDRAHAFNLVPLKAKIDGVLVERKTAPGKNISPQDDLLVVADLGKMTLVLEVRQEDVKYVRAGQPVYFKPDAADQAEAQGVVEDISPDVDPQTRTVKVRASLLNKTGWLLHRTYGVGRVVIRRDDQAIVIPSAALHWTGESHVVFVRHKNFDEKDHPKVFHVRSVRPGPRLEKTLPDGRVEQWTEIIVGLFPDEWIATTNSGVLRGDLLKGKIGAGEAD
jgi:cobalt-zinc-cadmium efflux system membrane fusion protein